jgi:hypothetical protein
VGAECVALLQRARKAWGLVCEWAALSTEQVCTIRRSQGRVAFSKQLLA